MVNIRLMEDQLLEELYASQNASYAAHLRSIVERHGELETAQMIIDQYEDTQNVSSSTDYVGFRINRHLLWPRVKREFDKLVCGCSPYEKENEQFGVLGQFYSMATATAMATSISQVISIPTYILTPTIVLMLNSLLKIGRNAYCGTVQI